MKTLDFDIPRKKGNRLTHYLGIIITLILAWPLAAMLIAHGDPTASYVDSSIWLLILMSMICFLGLLGICWWMLNTAWRALGLPVLKDLVLNFNQLELCYQLGFFLASYALLLLAAIGSLIAIC